MGYGPIQTKNIWYIHIKVNNVAKKLDKRKLQNTKRFETII